MHTSSPCTEFACELWWPFGRLSDRIWPHQLPTDLCMALDSLSAVLSSPQRSSLQQSLNTRLLEAAEAKEEGNRLLKLGKTQEALEAYLTAEAALEVYESAKVILSGRLCETLDRLLRDIRSNAAAAALKIGEWDAAVAAATAVLNEEPTHEKALYRRASAYLGRREQQRDRRHEAEGEASVVDGGSEGDDGGVEGSDAENLCKAREDLQALLKAHPSNLAARKLLDGIK